MNLAQAIVVSLFGLAACCWPLIRAHLFEARHDRSNAGFVGGTALSHCITCNAWIDRPCSWAGCELRHDARHDVTETLAGFNPSGSAGSGRGSVALEGVASPVSVRPPHLTEVSDA
jgi:hypothetical protein